MAALRENQCESKTKKNSAAVNEEHMWLIDVRNL
jgi:hypothetical protein